MMKGKRKLLITSIIAALFISTSVIAGASEIRSLQASDSSGKPQYVEGELIVTYSDTTSVFDKVKVREKHALTIVEELPLKNTELVKVPKGLTVAQAKAKIAFDPMVKNVQPNFLYYPSEITNDLYVGLEWGLDNTGQTINNVSGIADVDIDWAEARNSLPLNMSQVVVAVIDTGVDIDHPDLKGSIWINPNEIAGNRKDDDNNGYVDDINGWNFVNNNNDVFSNASADGHGTHVSGTIAAGINNGIGIAGIAGNAKIMSLKFIGVSGGSTTNAIKALAYAKANGAHISNNSWGGGAYDTSLQSAITSFGKPFIAAAGNESLNTDNTPTYPSAYPNSNIISVAAVNNRGGLADFSNYGLTTVDVGAPGVDIASTYPGGAYYYMSGTSMAAPHVSGIAALVLGANGSLSTEQVKSIILDSASANPIASLSGKSVTGGLVNALKALELAGGTIVNPPPVGDTVAPYAVSSVPANGAKNFKKANTLVVTFSEGITINNPGGISLEVASSSTSVNITLSTDAAKLVIDPVAVLLPYTKYTLTVSPGAVKDAAGNPNATTWTVTFTTGK